MAWKLFLEQINVPHIEGLIKGYTEKRKKKVKLLIPDAALIEFGIESKKPEY